jgi:opacity protein-like surface antigen
MKRACLTALTLVALTVAAAAAPAVTGTWTMTVLGSPHGDMTMGLTLEQKGTKVTGTLASPHGDMAVAGEFTDGTLNVATAGGDDEKITLNAKLKEDGTLAGYLSSPMGDMKWTAVRSEDKKK